MVYGFAKQSGGALRIYSEEKVGTTVRLFFPAVAKELRPRGAKTSPQQAESNDQRRETILIVEDQGYVGDLAQSVLQDFGYRTVRATNGQEAMAILEGNAEIDLLFTDLIMPGGINGVMLARAARKERPHLKVLLTSGYAELALERQDAGGAEFEIINKPYKRSELARKARQAIDGPNGIS